MGKDLKKKMLNKTTILKIAGGALAMVLVISLVYSLYSNDRRRTILAKQIAGYGPRGAVPATIDELKKTIKESEKSIDEYIVQVIQTGNYWKVLAASFRDKGLYMDAIESLEHAIRYFPDDAMLHYLLALSASQAALSMYDTVNRSGEAQKLFKVSESGFLRAIDLENDYALARHALAVLYVFNLDKPKEAIEQLKKYMELRSNDADAMFIMARAYYMLANYKEAIYWYERGIPLTKDTLQKEDAKKNIDFMRSFD
jgi:tetratricopeptide (TPR) repeat protein